jgi:hypothetical protein
MRESVQRKIKKIWNDPDLHPNERFFFLLEIPRLQDWPSKLTIPSEYFVLFLACDAKRKSNPLIRRVGRKAIRQGMRAACTWGPDCERVHDRLDDACNEFDSQPTSKSVVMTTWHSCEGLKEALWYFLHCAFATEKYSRRCRSWLAVVVGNPKLAAKAARYIKLQGCEVGSLLRQ